MCGWRDEIEEKRKRMERFRELLRSVQENQLAGLQTGGDFARERERPRAEGGSPGDRLRQYMPDFECERTPLGRIFLRRVSVDVDCSPGAPPPPPDAAPSTGAQQAPGDVYVTPKAARRIHAKRAPDVSDVWPDEIPQSAPQKKRKGGEVFDGEDWDPPPPPPADEEAGVEGIPRFRKAMRRAGIPPASGAADGGDERSRAPESLEPVTYYCRAGAPLSSASPGRLLDLLGGAAAEEAPFSLGDVAFLDTETSGLSGGAGMVAFLIGVGWFEAQDSPAPRFVVEQYLVEDFCHEEAVLARVEERLGRFRVFCTYNGKAFDLPLLRTRAVFNRRPAALWDRPNLDLLHMARRLWRGALPEVSLGMVERNILGHGRARDIEGALIPRVFFQFVRGRRIEEMVAVVDHHAQDVISLGALLARICAYLEAPDCPLITRSRELMGLGLWHERRGRPGAAAACFERAVSLSRDPAEQDALLSHLGRLRKRMRDWPAALEVWRRLLERPLPVALAAAVEIAKYEEHTARDVERARSVTLALIERLEREANLPGMTAGEEFEGALRQSPSAWLERLTHRLRRLNRRSGRDEVSRAGAADFLFGDEDSGEENPEGV